MNERTLILIGAFGGAAIGVLGGIVGTYFSIKNTNGPRERSFVVRCSVLCCLGVTAFLTALFLTPMSYRGLLWVAYMVVLPFAVRTWNRKQQQIRRDESGDSASSVS